MASSSLAEQVNYYIARLGEGDEDAYFHLLEADAAAEPLLLQAAAAEPDAHTRCALVEIVGKRKQTTSMPFLAERLFDQDWAVRQAAVDGLVTANSAPARRALEDALARCRTGGTEEARFAEYLVEAIGMIADEQGFRG